MACLADSLVALLPPKHVQMWSCSQTVSKSGWVRNQSSCFKNNRCGLAGVVKGARTSLAARLLSLKKWKGTAGYTFAIQVGMSEQPS